MPPSGHLSRLAIDSSVAGLPLVPAMNCVPHFVWNGVLFASGLGGHPCLTLSCIFSIHSAFTCGFQELIAKRKDSGHKTGGRRRNRLKGFKTSRDVTRPLWKPRWGRHNWIGASLDHIALRQFDEGICVSQGRAGANVSAVYFLSGHPRGKPELLLKYRLDYWCSWDQFFLKKVWGAPLCGHSSSW